MTRTVLIPSSLAREAGDMRMATRKIGYIARAATIFKVDRIGIFPDPDGVGDLGKEFVSTILGYAVTPPHLRKEMWGQRSELAYAGVLPPLRASPQAGSGSEDLESLRQGIVTQIRPDGCVWVICGMQNPISLIVPPNMDVALGQRVSVRVSSEDPVRARLLPEPPRGILVETVDIESALNRKDAGLKIATSRYGDPISISSLTGILTRVENEGMTVAFGAPGRGLPTILGFDPEISLKQKKDCFGFDCWINTIPNQASETVRTEEAMMASLALLSLQK
jgi:predicted SPOUT superfamily RNA methylase MTH1